MQIVNSYSKEGIFKTKFTDSGIVIMGLLILAILALCERLIYDLTRIFLFEKIDYFGNLQVITIHAVAIISFLVVSLVINYLIGAKKEKYAVVLVPYFIVAIVLAIQLSLQVIVYFTNHHTNLQFYIIMSLLVLISTYSMYYIQKRFNRNEVDPDSQFFGSAALLPSILGGILIVFILVMMIFGPKDTSSKTNLQSANNGYDQYEDDRRILEEYQRNQQEENLDVGLINPAHNVTYNINNNQRFPFVLDQELNFPDSSSISVGGFDIKGDWSVRFSMTSTAVENYRNIFDANFRPNGNNMGPRFEQSSDGLLQLVVGNGYQNFTTVSYGKIEPNKTYIVTAMRKGNQLIGYLDEEKVFDILNNKWPENFSNIFLGKGYSDDVDRAYRGKVEGLLISNTAILPN
jgi:uncharacterized membrane protein